MPSEKPGGLESGAVTPSGRGFFGEGSGASMACVIFVEMMGLWPAGRTIDDDDDNDDHFPPFA